MIILCSRFCCDLKHWRVIIKTILRLVCLMISQTIIISQANCTSNTRLRLALADIKEGLLQWRIWLLLSWQDIRLRYRRSTLGPFWITLSMAITIGMTGILYGSLFHSNLAEYFPAFSSGMLVWSFISASISEGSHIFIESESFLKRLKLPFSTFVFRTVVRNGIVFLHNSVIFIPIALIFHVPFHFCTLIAFVGLLFVIYNSITVGIILAVLGTRYRDISQVVNSLIQVIFFLTPIMWTSRMLPENYQFIVRFNPVAQFLEMVQKPLIGQLPSFYAFYVTLLVSIASTALALYLFSRFRGRITYWL